MHTFKRQTYSGQVVEFIKRCILDGELAPGEQVKEVTLSERLGISRAPIREALQILTQDGLITSEPQKGKYIRKMTRQEIENEYEIGGILEGAGVAAALPLMNHVGPRPALGHDRAYGPPCAQSGGPVRSSPKSTTPSTAPARPLREPAARGDGPFRLYEHLQISVL